MVDAKKRSFAIFLALKHRIMNLKDLIRFYKAQIAEDKNQLFLLYLNFIKIKFLIYLIVRHHVQKLKPNGVYILIISQLS